jgi:hypothetical protein
METISVFVAIAAGLSLLLAVLMIWYEYSPLAVAMDTRIVAVIFGLLSLILNVVWRVLAAGFLPVLLAFFALASLFWGIFLKWFTYHNIPVKVDCGDGVLLSGTLYYPVGKGFFPALVFLPDPQKPNPLDFQEQAKLLCRNKVAALVYDQRGSGASTGESGRHTYHTLAGDAAEMISAVRSIMWIDPRQVGLFAFGEAGWVAPLVVEKVPDLAGLVLVAVTHLSPAEQALHRIRQILAEAGFSQDDIHQALRFQRRILAYHRSGGEDTQTFQAEIDHAAGYPWFSVLEYFANLGDPGAYDWWRSVMDFNPEPRWQWIACPVLAISGRADRLFPVMEAHAVLRRALQKRGNRRFKSCLLPRMGHSLLDWWTPGKILPPRYPSGYRKCLLRWIDQYFSR